MSESSFHCQAAPRLVELVIRKTLGLTAAIESFSGRSNNPDRIHESFNLQHINRFLLATNLLQTVCKPKSSKPSTFRYNSSRRPQPIRTYTDARATDLLTTIQVLCAPMLLSFEPHISNHNFNFPDSQTAVYATASQWPIFNGAHGLDINMSFILHNINFWKYHMLQKHEQTLFRPFHELDADERPRWWSTQLKQGGQQQLGKHWKGSYAYMERPDVEALRRRRGEPTADQFQDSFAGEESACSFQDMQLHLTPDSHATIWPEAFERHLQSLTPPASRAKTRAQKRCATPDAIANFRPQSFRFDGEGQDLTEIFSAMGWLNPLPLQQGVPGWQRMTMMKYFDDDSEPSGIDLNALWAYEGVVLPGGQIVLGRWWSPCKEDEEMYSGPFILWCVDGPKYEDVEVEMEEAVSGWADPIEGASGVTCS